MNISQIIDKLEFCPNTVGNTQNIIKYKNMLRNICQGHWKNNKLQKLEDALVEQMLTAADLADRGDRGD